MPILENLRFRLSSRKREAGVFKNLLCGERFLKDAFSVTVFTGYVWTVGQTGEKLNRIRVDRASVVPYGNITLILRFAGETNFFVFVLFVYLSFSLELPHITTTKVTPESEYHMKIKV